MPRKLIILMTLFGLVACSSESKLDAPVATASSDNSSPAVPNSLSAGPPETGEPALHAVQNNRLQAVMHELNTLVYGRLSNEINWSKERAIKSEEISKIANELIASEKSIKDALPSLNLKSDEATAFVAVAGKLRSGATQLAELASQNQLQRLPETLEMITDTCISCHVLFRKSRSLIEKCKDPRYTC